MIILDGMSPLKKYFLGCFTDQFELIYIGEKLMKLLFNMGMSFKTVTGYIHIYSNGNDGKCIVPRVIFKKKIDYMFMTSCQNAHFLLLKLKYIRWTREQEK